MKSAIVLLSGGLDSSTTLALAQEDGFQTVAMTFRYGQRHDQEVEAARAVAKALGVVEHKVLTIDLRQFGASALTDEDIDVPEGRELKDIGKGIPSTYVPARNTILLSYALAWAEVLEARAVYIGANTLDYSGYPDCRPEYYQAFQEVARLGTRRGLEGDPVEIRYPLIEMRKADIVRKAQKLGVPLELTWSCYRGGKAACGLCDACQLRLKGFKEAGFEDFLTYQRYPTWYR